MFKQLSALAFVGLFLSACSSVPQQQPEAPVTAPPPSAAGGYLEGDGPGVDTPPNLDAIPNAVPKLEPLHRYANRPYTALGENYIPQTTAEPYKKRGVASWYGKKFHGQRTSSGEVYDMYAMTAAHTTLPLPSYVKVTNLSNQKTVIVRVNDRGPFLHDRIIDLSYTAAHKLGIIGTGSGVVEVESIDTNAVINTLTPNTVDTQPLESSASAYTVAAAPVGTVLGNQPAIISAPPAAALAPQTTNTGSYYLQLGAFGSLQNAESFVQRMRTQLGDTGKQIDLSTKNGLTRVNIGPYASQSEARSSADSMASKLGFKPMVNLP